MLHPPVPAVFRYRVWRLGPALNTLPFGATSILGYSGSASCAVVRLRQLLLPIWKTWGSVSTLVFEFTSPETTSASPLGSMVTVGYQRPLFISGMAVNTFFPGS